MITVPTLVDAVGVALLRLVVAGSGVHVDDVALAELDEGVIGVPGDLVLGVGISEESTAVGLLESVQRAGGGGVVLRSPLAATPGVAAAAERLGLALVELQPHASWAHLVWLLRGVIDRAAAPGASLLTDSDVHGELFALADAAAAILDAPVTIEDAQSRVLAYSARQEATDPTRVSTIVGRRVPEQIIAHFRARGVFRKLARSSEPIYVTDVPDQMLPRLVIPVRAGGEWLGSIWAAVTGPVAQDRVAELTRAASVVALHLLRLRAHAGVARRASTERLRAVLLGAAPTSTDTWLPETPWRVAALGTPSGGSEAKLDLWVAIARRCGWHQPLLADVDGIVLALITEHGATGTPGSAGWLCAAVSSVHPREPDLTAAIGGTAKDRSELTRSRAEAVELHRLLASGQLAPPITRIEQAWSAVVNARARAAVRIEDGLLGSPLGALLAHDREHGTDYISTLTAWLDHLGEPTAAASALHIHSNTLRYRMRRIAEAAPVDLASPTVRLALRLQLSALGADR